MQSSEARKMGSILTDHKQRITVYEELQMELNKLKLKVDNLNGMHQFPMEVRRSSTI